jgi:hypothetical protein
MYCYTYINATRDHTTLVIGSNRPTVQRHQETREAWERPGMVSHLSAKNIDNLLCACGDSMSLIDLDKLIPKDQPQVEED